MAEIKESFNVRLETALKIRCVRPVDLVKNTGISAPTISQYRSGYAKPGFSRIVVIANALGVDPAWLMGLDVPMESQTEMPEEMKNAAERESMRRLDGVKLPYLRKQELAEMLCLSKSTIQQRIGEMEASGRYSPYVVLRDGQVVEINVLAFIDWLKYRRMWADKHLRKYIPEYSAEKVAESMGWKIDRVNLRKVAI